MKVQFRTDASLQIGIGHVMRCLTLAEALRARGAECHFTCCEHEGHLLQQIRQRGFSVSGLPVCSDWETDLAYAKAIAREAEFDWLIVDHYDLDERWEQAMRPVCRRIMVIDDMADRRHDCDLLLDQNLGRTESDYSELVPKQCQTLVGGYYALLRPEFPALRTYSLARRYQPKLQHLLISMGGADLPNATGQVLEMLRRVPLPNDCRVTVVMGLHAPWLEEVRNRAAALPAPAEVKSDVTNMAQLLADSDLAIGAAGSTSWERCCLGVPSIVFVLAENQIAIANALQHAGAAEQFYIEDGLAETGKKISRLFKDFSAISSMSTNAAAVTDGRGCNRVVDSVLAMQLG